MGGLGHESNRQRVHRGVSRALPGPGGRAVWPEGAG